MLHVVLCITCDKVSCDGWTHATGEPFFSDSASMHDQMCDHMSPMSMNNLKANAQVPQSCMATKLPSLR